MSTGEGTEPGTGRTWPVRHGGGYPPGWQVRYRGRRPRTVFGTNAPRTGQERIGTIAGPTLRDEHTGTTWVAVRPFCAAPHTPLRLVRAKDIIDAQPPDEPDPTTAVDDE
jgi:hypothetical protein